MELFNRCPRTWMLYYVLTLCCIPFVSSGNQEPLVPHSQPHKRVAIIGAGAAGSNAAYSLRKYVDSSSIPADITVFERASYVGGRSTTVNVFDNPAYPVELGASIFVKVNYNLVNASRDLGLLVTSATQNRPKESSDVIGVWDGKEFVYRMQDTYDWWNIMKLIWRYGWSPVRAQNLMKATVNRFLQLYEPPIFPFQSLSEAAMASGLLNTTATRGSRLLADNSISPDFSREVIQAATRVNYGQNLGLIHGLEAMVCMATDGAVSIKGGNWQLFDAMLKASRANVRVNHTVTSIDQNEDHTLTVKFATSSSTQKSLVFDEVVIAGPMQFSNISINPPLKRTPDEIPYVNLHVTLFASPHRLSPKYFNLQGPDAQTPETILTTLPRNLDLGSNRTGVGPANFWSISTLQTVDSRSPNGETHYVYKIFSPGRPTAQFMQDLLGLQRTNSTSNGETTPSIRDLPKDDISWIHEKVWHPYPYLYPRVTFEESLLSPNIWYTGGMESFISTMETNAHMGKNVAALMFQSWLDQWRQDAHDELVSDGDIQTEL